MRYELTDYEYATIKPMLPNGVPRVNDRRILNGIFLGLAIRGTLARPTSGVRSIPLATTASFAGVEQVSSRTLISASMSAASCLSRRQATKLGRSRQAMELGLQRA